MTLVGFYHLSASTLDQALPRLLEQVLAEGRRVILRATSDERLEMLDRLLWTHDKASFLPHGRKADGHAERQPIWLTTGTERPNGASLLVLVDAAAAPDLATFERSVVMFDGRDPDAAAAAREHWRACRDGGHALSYWRQSPQGMWIKAQEIPGRPPAGDQPPSAAETASV